MDIRSEILILDIQFIQNSSGPIPNFRRETRSDSEDAGSTHFNAPIQQNPRAFKKPDESILVSILLWSILNFSALFQNF